MNHTMIILKLGRNNIKWIQALWHFQNYKINKRRPTINCRKQVLQSDNKGMQASLIKPCLWGCILCSLCHVDILVQAWNDLQQYYYKANAIYAEHWTSKSERSCISSQGHSFKGLHLRKPKSEENKKDAMKEFLHFLTSSVIELLCDVDRRCLQLPAKCLHPQYSQAPTNTIMYYVQEHSKWS